ncbi:MAG TPA: hypothetical protein VLA93_02690 [Pyrinomonadaceae bacterium]|nr:hypothetical protein [Pyrinomonadaceae bacterium]
MKPKTRTANAAVALTLAVLVLTASCFPTFNLRAGQSPQKSTKENDCKPVANRVCKLAVQITTLNGRGAGTDNAVYFDIGPLLWRLNNPGHNDFESGHTDEFDLNLQGSSRSVAHLNNRATAPRITT